MKNDKKILSTREVLALAMTSLRATAKPTLWIVVLGMVVPQLILSLLFDAYSGQVVAELRSAFTATQGAPTHFLALLAPAFAYLARLALFIILITLIIMTSYFALAHLAVDFHRAGDGLSARHAWLHGLRTTLPRGVIVGICLVFLTVIGQVLIAPAILVAVMSLAIPIILIAERRSALRALWDALTLRYVRQSIYSGWTVMFLLLSLAALFYTAAALIGLLSRWLLVADQTLDFWELTRGPWMTTFDAQPFGPVYLAVSLVEVSATMAMLSLFPSLTAALYFLVVGRRKLGEA